MDNKITSLGTLYNLVQLDQSEHFYRQFALLFFQAIQDWPTPYQDRIEAFLAELGNHFGLPLTEEKLLAAPLFDEQSSVWRAEAGSSILAMIRLAKQHGHSESFEQVCAQMLAYYEDEFRKVDFIATLTYKTTVEGGRKTDAYSGYRPMIKFPFTDELTSGQQLFIDREIAHPGQVLQAKIKLATPDFYRGKLSEEMEFEFSEGSTVVGFGAIDYIVNDELEHM